MRLYKYNSLDSSKGEIRLVTILPAQDKAARIRCQLLHITVAEAAGRYHAFSYTWGDSKNTLPITIDISPDINDAIFSPTARQERELNVTVNLEAALRRIRQRENPTFYWIDAISINQANNLERAQQVTMMGEIYSEARSVVAWLGPADPDSGKAFKLVEHFFNRLVADRLEFTEDTRAWVSSAVADESDNYSFSALRKLMQRPWWFRVWIIQEIVMAKDATLLCGDFDLCWEHFMVVGQGILLYLAAISRAIGWALVYRGDVGDGLIKHTSQACGPIIDGVEKLRSISRSFHQRTCNLPETFYDIIRIHRSSQATDPRDKVFALLGLASEHHVEIAALKPDYDLPLERLYRKVVQVHLQHHKNLDFLGDSCCLETPSGFSSWMPHWSNPSQISRVKGWEVKPEIEFSASAKCEARFAFSEMESILTLEGLLIDTVRAVGEALSLDHFPLSSEDPRTHTVLQWASLVGATDTLANYLTGYSIQEALLRTTLMNPRAPLIMDYQASDNPTYFEPQYTAIAVDRIGSEAEFKGILRSRQGMVCENRKLFCTAKGYYGIGLPDTCFGDLVCVFLGSKIPFIIRRKGDHYVLVGESYVHGLMSGEAIKEMERGDLIVQKFSLR